MRRRWMRALRWFGLAPRPLWRSSGARVIDVSSAIVELDADCSQFTTLLMRLPPVLLPGIHFWDEDHIFPRLAPAHWGDWAWVG